MKIGNKRLDQFGLIRVFASLHFLLLLCDVFHFLSGHILLLDFLIEHAHQVLDFIHLALDLIAVIIALGHILVELEVGLFDLCDGLGRRDQILGEVFLDLGGRAVNHGDVFQLLVIVCAAFFLFSIYLPNDRVYLLRELSSKLIKIELPPRFGATFSSLLEILLWSYTE